MELGLIGKTALVTASSRGLGRGCAEALAAEGARLVICGRHEGSLTDAAMSIRDMGADVLAVEADVTAPGVPARLVAETVERFGGLDILVANAGGPPPGRAFDVDDDAITEAVNANLLTSIRLVRVAVPYMRAAGWGRICLITSQFVKQPHPNLVLSNIARTGLWAWAKTAAADLFPDGITLNLACPGPHSTDRRRALANEDGGPVGDPADFGKVVTFLCSEPAKFVSGAALQIDGALTTGLL